MQLLDTDVAIDFLRNYEPAIQWLNQESDTLFAIPGLVAMELIQGCRSKDEQRKVNAFIRKYDLIWPNELDCEEALKVLSEYYLSHGIGLLDALIATTATGLDAPLVTFNQKHYRIVSRLRTIQPYQH